MKDDVDNVSEVLLDPDDSSNVRFKRSIIQINRSNNSTPISEFIRGFRYKMQIAMLFCSNFFVQTSNFIPPPLYCKKVP